MALEARLGVTLTPGEREVLAKVGEALVAELLSGPQVLAHRDFQSQNLMVTPRGLVLVDFQDAFIAPDVYDLVALLRDSYVVLAPAELEHHLARFALITARPLAPLRERFLLQTIQRKLKDAGRFETLARKGKTGFLAFFADSIGYVVHALVTSGRFPDLLDLLRTRLLEARTAP
jgi:aminoglycoside/choline kinase family phosphotransferase